jgi:hypothetical protein
MVDWIQDGGYSQTILNTKSNWEVSVNLHSKKFNYKNISKNEFIKFADSLTEEVNLDEEIYKQTNGVKWELAPEADRLKGNYFVAFDTSTKKIVAYGLTKVGAEKIAKTHKNLIAKHADDVVFKESYDQILTEDKLENDVKSLKKIGWKLDKITKFLITKGDEYGVKMTSDLIAMYFNNKDGNTVTLPGTNIKIAKSKTPPRQKKPKWPNDPPKSKINDIGHAQSYLDQAIASDESPDMSGTEAYRLLDTAGYTEKVKLAVIKNMGWNDAEFERSYNRMWKGKG